MIELELKQIAEKKTAQIIKKEFDNYRKKPYSIFIKHKLMSTYK
jgi:hypothetical protein